MHKTRRNRPWLWRMSCLCYGLLCMAWQGSVPGNTPPHAVHSAQQTATTAPPLVSPNPFGTAMQSEGITCHPHTSTMDFDIQAAQAQSVLWDIAHCAQWDLQIKAPLKDKITLHAHHVSPAQAMGWVLADQDLQVIRHGPLRVIAPSHHETTHSWHPITLQHTDIHQLQKQWHKHPLLEAHEKWLPDIQHNRGWLHCSDQRWPALRALITAWDQPVPQIAIRAMIMQVDDHTVRSLGALIQAQSSHALHDPSWPHGAGAPLHVQIATLGLQQMLTATLQAATESGHGRMLASPYLLTLNHHPAEIETGAEIPYTEKTIYGDSSTIFKKAVLQLAVTPHVLGSGQMQLDIQLIQDHVNPLGDSETPTIQTRAIKTQVRLGSGHTLVLGGIEQQNLRHRTESTPGIDRVPVLKQILRRKHRRVEHQQLLLLITPTLVSADTASPVALPAPFGL